VKILPGDFPALSSGSADPEAPSRDPLVRDGGSTGQANRRHNEPVRSIICRLPESHHGCRPETGVRAQSPRASR